MPHDFSIAMKRDTSKTSDATVRGGEGGGPPNANGGSGGGDDPRRKREGVDTPSPPSLRKRCRPNEESVPANTDDRPTENNSASSVTDNGAEHLESDMDQAIRRSIRDSVGAYSIVPGGHTTRREPHDPSAVSSNDRQQDLDDDTPHIPSEIPYPYHSSNLPPNIDIVAEATLVVEDHNYEQLFRMARQQQNGEQSQTTPREDDGGSDADTFGLHCEARPRPGGANDDSASVAVSAITAPAFSRRTDDDADGQGLSLPTEELHRHEVPDVDEEQGAAATCAPTVQSSIVVHATPINDGPFAFLETRSGKFAVAVSLIAIFFLTISLSMGLTSRDDVSDNEDAPLQEDDVLTRAAGNFCSSSTPLVFYGMYSTFCTQEELARGGTLQQAIAIAQEKQSRRGADVSILNAGAVRSEIQAGSPVTADTIYTILPFRDNTVSYLELTGSDLMRVIDNAVGYASQVVPLDSNYGGGYPYASGLRFDVNLSSATEKVLNVQVYDSQSQIWLAMDTEDAKEKSYMVVTSSFIAGGGDDYLTDIEPLNMNVTDIGYTEEVVNYLRDLEGEWEPPELDQMSTTSFVAI